MKIGLYSITYLGCWYRGEALALPELIRTAKKVRLTTAWKLMASGRMATRSTGPKNKCQELRQLADREGIEIVGVAPTNDFSNPVPEVREAQICFLRAVDPHDRRSRRERCAGVSRLVGHHAHPQLALTTSRRI